MEATDDNGKLKVRKWTDSKRSFMMFMSAIFLIGAAFAGASLLLSVVGVVFLPVLAWISISPVQYVQGKRKVYCPSCGRKNYVEEGSQALECKKCGAETPVEWRPAVG